MLRKKIIFALLVIIVLLGLTGYGLWLFRDNDHAPDWLRTAILPPEQSGQLVVLTLPSSTSTLDNPDGYEYDLVSLFARELGVLVRFVKLPSHAALIEQLAKNRSHLAAAELLETPQLIARFAASPSYRTVQFQLIGRSNDKKISSFNEAANEHIAVVAGTPAHELINELRTVYPKIIIDLLPHETDTEGLLQQVSNSRSRFALVSADSFLLGKRTHPDLTALFKAGREMKVSWFFSPIADIALKEKVQQFFEKVSKNGTLTRLHDRYYGHAHRIAPVDSEALIGKVESLLPDLRPHFQEAETLTGIEWRLLAAIAYQESHWDSKAESPTGVRGLMMLTEDTAERMGVKDLTDPRESIIGGAKYLVLLKNTVPARIAEPDRTWLALAAYNQGYGHLEDARILTQRMKLNPDSWPDVRKAYPLLSDPVHYETVEHGYCRGEEAVALVEAIRNYYDILNKLTALEDPLKTLVKIPAELEKK